MPQPTWTPNCRPRCCLREAWPCPYATNCREAAHVSDHRSARRAISITPRGHTMQTHWVVSLQRPAWNKWLASANAEKRKSLGGGLRLGLDWGRGGPKPRQMQTRLSTLTSEGRCACPAASMKAEAVKTQTPLEANVTSGRKVEDERGDCMPAANTIWAV